MLSQTQMVDLAARLKQATETLSLDWYVAVSGLSQNRIMRCKRTSHCVGSAILTTARADATPQFFLFLPDSDYELLGISKEDVITVVGAGDGWSTEYCEEYAKRHDRQFDGVSVVPTLRAMFLEAVGLSE